MTDHLITTTMQPDEVVLVSDQELTDLRRMGLVASEISEETDGSQEESEPDGEQAPEDEPQRLRSAGKGS